MIIGAQKSGTTSLLRYLGEHPEIIAHPQKEFAYFLDPSAYHHELKNAMNKYFPGTGQQSGKKILAKNAPLYTNPEALQLLREKCPSCKLILILRDPVDRLYSSFLLEKNAGHESRKFEEIFNRSADIDIQKGTYYFQYSLYSEHVKNVFTIFPGDQIKIVLYKNLKEDPQSVCRELFRWMEVSSDFIPNTEVIHNKTKKTRSQHLARLIRRLTANNGMLKKTVKLVVPDSKTYKLGELARKGNYSKEEYPDMTTETKNYLREMLLDDICKLEHITGMNLEFWKKKNA